MLIKPVLPLVLRVLDLLNTIPPSDKKQNSPFSECLLANTASLQITLRRSIFMNIYESSETPEAQVILTFFRRLEEELQGVNLLQRGVWSSIEKANEAYKTFQ